MIALMALASVSFVGYRWWTREARAIAEIQRVGGNVRSGEDSFGVFRGADVLGGDRLIALLPFIRDLKIVLIDEHDVTDAGLAPLAQLNKLEDLWLHNCPISDAGVAHLAGLTNLVTLGLDHTHVSDAGLAHLKGMQKLEFLDLSGNSAISDAAVPRLAALKALQRVDLDGTGFSDEGRQRLREACPELLLER